MRLRRRDVIAGAALAAGAGAAMAAKGNVIEVRARPGATTGVLSLAGREHPCAVGRSGIVHPKFEGDGGTPAGLFALREVRYRPDRLARPPTGLPVYQAAESDGWCDDPADPNYNRLVRLPYQSDAEEMWRADHLYDLVTVIGYNDAPTVPGAGSAVFMHVARSVGDALGPTSGCVSMRLPDVLAVLAALAPGAMIDIRAG